MGVKILDIQLKNFRRFYEGMNRKEVKITFDKKYSTYMIKGDNGVGKSTLLEELNPLPGIRRGYDIIPGETGEKIVTFIGVDGEVYRVHYVYKPNKDGHSCQGDIIKLVKGQKVSISENSSVTDTIAKIKTLTGIDNKLYKLSAIGIGFDDRGIVSMSAANRRKFLQEISPLGDTKELLKTVSEKYTFHKKTREACEMKLAGLPSLDSMTESKSNLTLEKNNLLSKKNLMFSDDLMEDIEFNLLKQEEEDLRAKMNDLVHVKNLIRNNSLLIPINEHNKRLEESISVNRGKVMALNDSLLKNKQKLAMVVLETTTDINDLENSISNHEFHNMTGEHLENESDIRLMEYYYKTITSSITSIMYDCIPEGYSLQTLLNMTHDESVRSIVSKIEDNKFNLEKMEKLKQENYVPTAWNVQRSLSCSDDNCPLYVKFKGIYDKLEKYETVLSDIQRTESKLEELHKHMQVLSMRDKVLHELDNVYSMIDDNSELLSKITPIFKSSTNLKRHILSNGMMNFDDIVSSLSYNTRIYLSYMNLKNEYDILKKNDVVSLGVEIGEIETEIEKLTESINKDSETLIPLGNKYSSYGHMYIRDIDEVIDNTNNRLLEIVKILTIEEKKRNDYELIKSDMVSIEEKLNSIEKQITDIDNNIFLYKHNVDELESHTLDETDTLKIRDTLRTHLPVKILNKIILELKDKTNEFLDSTDLDYRVHSFEISSDEFTIKVQKGSYVNEDIGKMSNGELMIMTLATTLALNNIMLGSYDIMTLDEMDATLSEVNRKKFLDILMNFKLFKDVQMFIVSHNSFYNTQASNDIGVIQLSNKGDIAVLPFDKYIL